MNLKNNPPAGGQVLLIFILILSLLGFIDATYLTISHYQHAIPPCTISNGCETVLTSSYATVLGIPTALFGSLYYLGLIGLSLLLLTAPKKIFLNLLLLIAASGAIVSAVLIYIQFGILKTYCQYCVISEIISFLILGLVFFLHLQSDRQSARRMHDLPAGRQGN